MKELHNALTIQPLSATHGTRGMESVFLCLFKHHAPAPCQAAYQLGKATLMANARLPVNWALVMLLANWHGRCLHDRRAKLAEWLCNLNLDSRLLHAVCGVADNLRRQGAHHTCALVLLQNFADSFALT